MQTIGFINLNEQGCMDLEGDPKGRLHQIIQEFICSSTKNPIEVYIEAKRETGLKTTLCIADKVFPAREGIRNLN